MGMPINPACARVQLSVKLPMIFPEENAIKNKITPNPKITICFFLPESEFFLYSKPTNTIIASMNTASTMYVKYWAIKPSMAVQSPRFTPTRL